MATRPLASPRLLLVLVVEEEAQAEAEAGVVAEGVVVVVVVATPSDVASIVDLKNTSLLMEVTATNQLIKLASRPINRSFMTPKKVAPVEANLLLPTMTRRAMAIAGSLEASS